MWRKLFGAVLLLALVLFGLVWSAARVIQKNSRASVYDKVSDVPHKHVALVLGCAPILGNGMQNPFFNNRIGAAAALFQSGRVDYLLLSGDNHTVGYDEPSAMKDALAQHGVPAERMVLDYAGFSTSDSVLRAARIFGQRDLCIISQRDHAMRAIYIAQNKRIEAVGFAARDITVRVAWRTRIRESFARVRALLDVHVWGRKPHFGGLPVEIGGRTDALPIAGAGEDDVGV